MSTLDDLRQWRHLHTQRDHLILQARREGHTWDEITDATGLSRAAAHNAAQRANDGKPIPGNPRFNAPYRE
ncbi:hypothetical protein [Brevibacterium otitidis]|uniref:AsnC family protein n=1 Tax=Brevibacterium otitidis TaxID=53364 RepID=A0ABV5X105_9MICO|nr:hypothetical protein GCM10023233_04810 [Brevibacterium otitidis]